MSTGGLHGEFAATVACGWVTDILVRLCAEFLRGEFIVEDLGGISTDS